MRSATSVSAPENC